VDILSLKEFSNQTYFKRKKTGFYKKKTISIQLKGKRKKRIKAETPDWRRAYISPSDRTADQMRNPLGYRGTS